MYQYFVSNPVVAFIFIAIVLVGIIYLLVKKLQNMGLEKIRATVYNAFIEAEKIEYAGYLDKSFFTFEFSPKFENKPDFLFNLWASSTIKTSNELDSQS